MEGRDVRFMTLALRLARKAKWATSPNPAVGAVIVKRGRIIGSGYHKRAGGPHAEIEALRQAGLRARRASLYVTLEPCSHFGRTPPCTDAILASGISQVVIAARDPNPITHGRGIARLRRCGMHVTTNVLAQEARQLNEPFWKAMTDRLPFAIAKIGQSLDGKIATVTGQSHWITSGSSRRIGHLWRSKVDAVLVGVNTILRDDPLLTVRGFSHRRRFPLKVVVDSHLRTPAKAQCLSRSSPAPTLIATISHKRAERLALERRGAQVLVFEGAYGRVPLRALFRELARRGIHSILIEGGGEILFGALRERLVDRIVWFIAPILIGGRMAPSAVAGNGIRHLSQAIQLADVKMRRVGSDLCVEARVVYPKKRDRRQETGDRGSRTARPVSRPMSHVSCLKR